MKHSDYSQSAARGNPLSSADADRLAKLLRLLGSDYDGEVIAAGRAAHQYVQRLKVEWREVLSCPAGPAPAAPTPCPPPRQPVGGRREQLDWLRERVNLLSAWEAGFVCDLAGRSCTPSPRQAAKLHEIARRVGLRSGGL